MLAIPLSAFLNEESSLRRVVPGHPILCEFDLSRLLGPVDSGKWTTGHQ